VAECFRPRSWGKGSASRFGLGESEGRDDSEATSFAAARDGPPHLADASGLGNDRADLRIVDQRPLEPRILIVAQILLHQTREQLGLDEADHSGIVLRQ
jgi:hypothetical protein